MRLPPIPALILSMLSIQGGAAFAKGLFPAVGSGGASALRVLLAAALLLAFFRPRLGELTRQDWRVILPYGAALGLMNLSFYAALERLPLGIAVTLEFVGPLLLSLALSRRALDVVWVALAGAGVWLIVPHAGGAGLDVLGVGLALLAGAFWAGYILAGGAVGRRLPGTVGVVAGMLVAALVTVPFGVVQAGPALLHPPLLLLGVGVALFSSALPYTLEMAALRSISPKVFGVLMSLEPAIAALSGLVLLHERLTPAQWLALACVAVASAGISLTGGKSTEGEAAS